jgi:hypothetical protein
MQTNQQYISFEIFHELQKKIYPYLHRIAFGGINLYKTNNNGLLVIKDNILLDSFVKSEYIIPETINYHTFYINGELLMPQLMNHDSEDTIKKEIEQQTLLIYESIIKGLYSLERPFIDLLLLNLNKILMEHGFRFDLEGRNIDNNLIKIPKTYYENNHKLFGSSLNFLYKRFIKYNTETISNKIITTFNLHIISPNGQKNIFTFLYLIIKH